MLYPLSYEGLKSCDCAVAISARPIVSNQVTTVAAARGTITIGVAMTPGPRNLTEREPSDALSCLQSPRTDHVGECLIIPFVLVDRPRRQHLQMSARDDERFAMRTSIRRYFQAGATLEMSGRSGPPGRQVTVRRVYIPAV